MKHLSVSSLQCYRACPRQFYLSRRMKLRKSIQSEPLRMGGVWALALEAQRTGGDGYAVIDDRYAETPAWAEPLAWAYEHTTLRTLLAGYLWRYTDDAIQITEAEAAFSMPLCNPATGRPSRLFTLDGRIDAIGQHDARKIVVETKLLGKDLAPDADWWQRLRYDSQLSTYMLARPDCTGIIYDCTRKPTIRPCMVPTLDADGLKIYLDANGQRALNKNGTPRQSAGEGLTLQAEPETPEAWGSRLLADIESRPEFYYARRDIPRTEDVLRDHAAELWQQAQAIHQSDRNGWWYRNVSYNTCDFCEFAGPCLGGVEISRDIAPPSGYELAQDDQPAAM